MEEDATKEQWWHDGLVFFIKVSGWIAGPILLVMLVETILEHYFTPPRFTFFVLMFIGFVISIYGLVKESMGYIEKVSKKQESK